ncbi:MAG TPA: TPM domain-containing protein [Candidatus Paceibacterota bacterium]
MSTFGKLVFVSLLLIVVIATTTRAQEYPKATGYVSDFANLLTAEQGASLNGELVAFEKRSTIEIAVVIVDSLNGENIDNYTRGLAIAWGVGKRGKDNGVVFLVAPNERKMRIETASGIRLVLTDHIANKIRDEVVLPLFKAGDMQKGVIDGTHTIMRSLNTTSLAASQNISDSEVVNSNELTFLGAVQVLAVIIGFITLLLIGSYLIQRSESRVRALKYKESFLERLVEGEKLAINPDVKGITRKRLESLKKDFFASSIDQLTAVSKNIRWGVVEHELYQFDYSIDGVLRNMKDEIAFAKKARKEGPGLMKKIPDMLESAQKELSKGKKSKKAEEYLEEARSQYVKAQDEYLGVAVINWVVLYAILVGIESNTVKAESFHQSANTDHSNDHSSGEPNSSYGFSDSNSGFSGGGGFEGGGSSGSW